MFDRTYRDLLLRLAGRPLYMFDRTHRDLLANGALEPVCDTRALKTMYRLFASSKFNEISAVAVGYTFSSQIMQ
jgi:hypothetical protein